MRPVTVTIFAIIAFGFCGCCAKETVRREIVDWPSKSNNLNNSEIVFVLKNYYPDLYLEITENAHDRGAHHYRGFVSSVNGKDSINIDFARSFPPEPLEIINMNIIVVGSAGFKARATIVSIDKYRATAILKPDLESNKPIEIGDSFVFQ